MAGLRLTPRLSFVLDKAMADGSIGGGPRVVWESLAGRQVILDGTGADQADEAFFTLNNDLAASATETVDLQGAPDIDGGGNITLVEVVFLVIEAGADNVGTLTIQPGSTNGWTNLLGSGSTVILQPGACAILAMSADPGWAVTPTNKTLDIVNNDGSNAATYTACVVGRSA